MSNLLLIVGLAAGSLVAGVAIGFGIYLAFAAWIQLGEMNDETEERE
jgi:hypothetical protein